MKLQLVILFLLNYYCYGQNHEFDIGFQGAVPLSNLNVKQPTVFTRYDIYKMESLSDAGFSFLYKYRIWKKQSLFLTAGIAFSHAKHSLPLLQYGTHEIFARVLIANERFTFKIFGLEKKIACYDNRLYINLGWSLVSQQYYLKDHQNYAGNNLPVVNDLVKNFKSITYDYDVDVYYNQTKQGPTGYKELYWNGEYYLQFQGKLTDNLSLNLTLNYYRNIIFYYNYSYTYLFDDGTSKSVSTFGGLSGNLDPHYGIQTHFLALKLSCSFKI